MQRTSVTAFVLAARDLSSIARRQCALLGYTGDYDGRKLSEACKHVVEPIDDVKVGSCIRTLSYQTRAIPSKISDTPHAKSGNTRPPVNVSSS